ncbi:glycoside hydrolase family 65 protein [Mucilaginibacter rubeus]|uniref:Glycoside hydrolase family 65 protein n=2 Tax=Sphingobacteriaceae TaxID=84566 RepID=A0AAE6JMS0_9SPHI|nr:glycoside hydrolase family 65 protein [Mucilaginibacter rubeus]QEM20696.1 glycoside hydrolase family 65 protein [Mucilaginibacter gossypii]QTE47051.1 glycoside hydrolase family 65 protein [Mucilaginibacter rubeus]QTE53653.1 glycoside hydrolase family 65 protein [Mucilaginibacter rubeus]QTE60153.1 glycoside hydrolase family 65 protein [Mucilaginibacter rubeus]
MSEAQSIDPWKIKAEKIDPSNYYGITVANGMIGIVSAPEPFKVKNVVLAGAYDLYGRGRVSNFLNSFNLLNMFLEIDGRRIDAKSINNFKQELDMQHAAFTTTFDYADKATIKYTYYSLRQLPFTVLMDVSVMAKQAINITSASVMEAPDALKEVQNYYNEIDRPHVTISLLTSTAKSPTGKMQLCASTSFLFSEPHGQEPRIIHEMWDNNMHLMKFSKTIAAGQTYNYAVTGSSITSAHHADPLNEAERLTIFAKLEGRDRLIKFHNKAWDDLWTSDIQIEGDDQSQQDIHSMLYHLYSFSRAGTAYSPSPMGLSGLGYNGHVFWDCDVWMYPAMLVLHPDIAKSMIEYRFERLDAARKNAFSHGYKGAMFPWESADSGVEETPVWALSGPFEHHITADVALTAWNYYCVTQDKQWLKERGWPILSATADFWASRVERNGPGHYDIKNVVAADEWAENIDNNAFTNAAAKANLLNATAAAKILGEKADVDWANVAQNIPILRLDNGVTREHASYKGEGIKQADVNLLAYPLKTITDPAQIKKDLEYYETRVPNEGTPAMTQAVFALLYSRLGNGEKAFHFFKDAYEPNLNPPFRVIAETKGGTNPYFATGAGGIIQSLLMGFGGLDITPTGIVQVKSKLPANWKSLKITGVGINKTTYKIK